jgi:hypothetical protein
LSKLILGRYTRQSLWSLFLVCAFSLHIWTLILGLRDMPWVTDRTNVWDAVGVISYGLLFALIESAVLFLAAVLLGFLVPRRWEPDRRAALLGSLALVLSLWSMLEQLFFLTQARVPDGILAFLVQSAHPLRSMYAILLVPVVITVLPPAWAALRPGRGLRFMQAALDRLGLLAMLYLVLDAAALVIVLIRNL